MGKLFVAMNSRIRFFLFSLLAFVLLPPSGSLIGRLQLCGKNTVRNASLGLFWVWIGLYRKSGGSVFLVVGSQKIGDLARLAVSDLSPVNRSDGDDFSGGSGEEAFISRIQIVAHQRFS